MADSRFKAGDPRINYAGGPTKEAEVKKWYEIAETGRRAETSAGKTTAEQVEADLEYHKGMRIALFLGYQFQQNSVKNSRPGTHGRVFVGSAVQRSFP